MHCSGRTSRTSRKKSSGQKSRRAKVHPSEKLQPDEAQHVLEQLLAAHPELKKEADAHALALARSDEFEGIAEWLDSDLRGLDLDELNDRAGDNGFGYLDPVDAGAEARALLWPGFGLI